MTMQLVISKSRFTHGRTIPCQSLEGASHAYCCVRDDSGEGASTFPDGKVLADGKTLRISYNGRIWDGETCVFNPYE